MAVQLQWSYQLTHSAIDLAMSTDRDLVGLIDLSLGVEPHGVVNFNFLHGLMHGIVKRLVTLESSPEHFQGKGLAGADVLEGDEDQLSRGDSGGGGSGDISASPKQASRTSIRQYSSLARSRPSLVSAANDLGALERKLQDLEHRMSTMESLPELLERVSSDAGATTTCTVP